MKDDRSIELIHAELDRALSGEEQKELTERLEGDPSLRALREDLRKLAGFLDRVPPAEPPPGLKHRILAAVRPKRAKQKRPGLMATLLPSWPAPVALRYAGAALFGAAIAAVALQLGTIHVSGPADVRGLVGTISSYETPAVPQSILSLDSGGISGVVETNRQSGLVVLDFDLEADRPIRIVADYSRSGLDFSGFAQLDDDAEASLDAGMGLISFSQGHNQRFAVFFSTAEGNGGAGAIELRFFQDQALVRTETVDIPANGRK